MRGSRSRPSSPCRAVRAPDRARNGLWAEALVSEGRAEPRERGEDVGFSAAPVARGCRSRAKDGLQPAQLPDALESRRCAETVRAKRGWLRQASAPCRLAPPLRAHRSPGTGSVTGLMCGLGEGPGSCRWGKKSLTVALVGGPGRASCPVLPLAFLQNTGPREGIIPTMP